MRLYPRREGGWVLLLVRAPFLPVVGKCVSPVSQRHHRSGRGINHRFLEVNVLRNCLLAYTLPLDHGTSHLARSGSVDHIHNPWDTFPCGSALNPCGPHIPPTGASLSTTIHPSDEPTTLHAKCVLPTLLGRGRTRDTGRY